MSQHIAAGPVHWLENVEGRPEIVRTACKTLQWFDTSARPLDPHRVQLVPVTCPGCLEAMAALMPVPDILVEADP